MVMIGRKYLIADVFVETPKRNNQLNKKKLIGKNSPFFFGLPCGSWNSKPTWFPDMPLTWCDLCGPRSWYPATWKAVVMFQMFDEYLFGIKLAFFNWKYIEIYLYFKKKKVFKKNNKFLKSCTKNYTKNCGQND